MEADKMNPDMLQERAKMIARLKKIEGQVRGIQKMIVSGANCSDILVQVAAVKSAVNKVGTLVFEKHAQQCLRNARDGYEESEQVEELMRILSGFIK